MEREADLDKDGDGLPEGYGNCNTYEGRFYGADSYDSSLWLCALKVFPEVARLMEEEIVAEKYEKLFEKASESFEKKLWDKERECYIKCTQKGSTDPNTQCRDDQLAGQWYSHFLHKGYLHSRERVTKALQTMLRILKVDIPEGGGKYIIRQEEFENNTPVDWNWPGFSIAHFSAEAIYEGLIEEGLEAAEGIWELIFNRYKKAWDQPLSLSPYRKPRGDRYMNSGSIWYLLWALQGFWIDIKKGIIRISPNIPQEWKKQFISPIVTGSFWGRLEWQEYMENSRVDFVCSITLDKNFSLKTLILKGFKDYRLLRSSIEGYNIDNFEVKEQNWDYNEVVFNFKKEIGVLAGKPLTIKYSVARISN